jgi:hypothetical protein
MIKYNKIIGECDDHAAGLIWHKAHRPVEHIGGFMWSLQMLPLSECLHRIVVVVFIE